MKRLALFVLTSSALVAGCGGSSSSPTDVVQPPQPPTTTEVFTGTISPFPSAQSVRSHNFTVTQTGTMTIGLTSAGPPPTIKIGVGVGTPNADGVCAIPVGNGFELAAAPTPQLTGTATAGATCVAVFDSGNMVADVDYSVTVVHP